jgi:hypothetical protein
MIRIQPKDVADQEEENKKAKQSVIENFVLFFVTVGIIKAVPYIVEHLS